MDYIVIFQVFWCESRRRGVMRLWVLKRVPQIPGYPYCSADIVQ